MCARSRDFIHRWSFYCAAFGLVQLDQPSNKSFMISRWIAMAHDDGQKASKRENSPRPHLCQQRSALYEHNKNRTQACDANYYSTSYPFDPFAKNAKEGVRRTKRGPQISLVCRWWDPRIPFPPGPGGAGRQPLAAARLAVKMAREMTQSIQTIPQRVETSAKCSIDFHLRLVLRGDHGPDERAHALEQTADPLEQTRLHLSSTSGEFKFTF